MRLTRTSTSPTLTIITTALTVARCVRRSVLGSLMRVFELLDTIPRALSTLAAYRCLQPLHRAVGSTMLQMTSDVGPALTRAHAAISRTAPLITSGFKVVQNTTKALANERSLLRRLMPWATTGISLATAGAFIARKISGSVAAQPRDDTVLIVVILTLLLLSRLRRRNARWASFASHFAAAAIMATGARDTPDIPSLDPARFVLRNTNASTHIPHGYTVGGIYARSHDANSTRSTARAATTHPNYQHGAT